MTIRKAIGWKVWGGCLMFMAAAVPLRFVVGTDVLGVEDSGESETVLTEREYVVTALVEKLMDPALMQQRRQASDPFIYQAGELTIKLYESRTKMEKEIVAMSAKRKNDPFLNGARLDSLRAGGLGNVMLGYYDEETKTVFSIDNPDVLTHELRHHFYPEEQHPHFQTLTEWKEERGKKNP